MSKHPRLMTGSLTDLDSSSVMWPGTIHCVYTPEPSIASGRHFLNYKWLCGHIEVCRDHEPNGDSTNEYLPITEVYLHLMAIALNDPDWRTTVGCVGEEKEKMVRLLRGVVANPLFNKKNIYGGEEQDRQAVRKACKFMKPFALAVLDSL